VLPNEFSSAFSLADQYLYRNSFPNVTLATPESDCRSIAQKAMQDYGTLPATKGFEFYLVRGLAVPPGGTDKDMRVIYSCEFVYLLDVGLDSLVGVVVPWDAAGLGDPTFPDFSKHSLRSISSRGSGDIIFPNIAGSIMVGVKEGVSDDTVRAEFEQLMLKNIQGSGWFWTAECQPFVERQVCRQIESTLSFVKYAEPNSLQRLIDFSPGWPCVRLV
jgi:hypothetical protein